jgi:TRAP transporter TAXI family solute receptor
MTMLRLAAASFAAVLLTSAAHAQTIGIAATQPGSHTHSSSTAIAKAISDKTDLQVRVQPQGASPQYAVTSRTAEFGLSNSFDTVFFKTGTGEYDGQGAKPNLMVAANITPLFTTIYVKKDSPIQTVAALKGKRLPGGFNAQKTIARILSGMLATANLTYSDVQVVPAANIVNSADDFAAGKTDAFTFALGSAKVKEVDAKVGGLRALSFDPSAAATARLQKWLPGAYMLPVKPRPGLDGVSSEVNTVAFDFLLNTHDKVAEDIVYKVVKAIHGGKDGIVATFPALRTFEPDKMAARSYAPVQYHPGAIKFYKEIGQWPPKG